jgi:hypothetical protein
VPLVRESGTLSGRGSLRHLCEPKVPHRLCECPVLGSKRRCSFNWYEAFKPPSMACEGENKTVRVRPKTDDIIVVVNGS